MVRWLTLLAYLALAGATAAAALFVADEPAAGARVLATGGSFEMSNSADGMPIFVAEDIAPGDSVAGTVEVAATGTEAGALTLTQHDLADVPGPGGGKLSTQLTLRVRELTGTPAVVYSGPLEAMPALALGRIEPGRSRSFEFVATLPELGAAVDQNAVQGSSTSVGFEWAASDDSEAPPAAEPGPGPAPTPSPQPLPPSPSLSPGLLTLAVTKVQRRVRHGRLLIRARCDRACAIRVRGRLTATGPGGKRKAKLRPARRPRLASGPQRLVLHVPRGFRAWLARTPGRERLQASLLLGARDAAGQSASVKRTLRPRVSPPLPTR